MVRGIDTIEHAEAKVDEEAQSRLPQELKVRLEKLRHFAFQQADQWSARVAFRELPDERIASCVDALRFDGWSSVFWR
jgi:phage-related tail protein